MNYSILPICMLIVNQEQQVSRKGKKSRSRSHRRRSRNEKKSRSCSRKGKKSRSRRGSPERERNPGACPGNPGAVPEKERSPEAAQGREERLVTLGEADPAGPGAAPERRFVGLHTAGPRAPRDAVLPFLT